MHIILHDEEAAAANPTRALGTEIYSRLARGSRPTGIPVHVWTGKGEPDKAILPLQPPLKRSARNAIVLLIDQPFFDARKGWQPYLDTLAETRNSRGGRDLLLPVSICADAHQVTTTLGDINCVPVKDPDKLASDEHIFQAILTAILRLLPETVDPRPDKRRTTDRPPASAAAPPRVFLCHTKSDGEDLAHELRRYIYEHTQLNCFFDTHDIPHGLGVREFIESSISASCLLVVWTDKLLESRWCQFEILAAREQQRPLLVLDALCNRSPRIFPFLGNMPVVHWRNNAAQVVSALLLELVRARHLRVLFDSLRGAGTAAPRFMLYPPDIMKAAESRRAAGRAGNQPVVYPDPPLSVEELDFLRKAFPALRLYSISEWTARRAAGTLSDRTASRGQERPMPFMGLSIGLSISETESWKSQGLISEHQDDFAEAMARELILLGASLLWGGDLRPEGLGGRLETLVRAYHQSTHAPQDHIACILAWPNYRDVSAKEIRARRAFADVRCLPRPAPDSVEAPSDALDAISFSLMRKELAERSHARIILGGRLTGYRGRYSGIAEEALETINSGIPLYIIGGFGGASRGVYDAILHPRSKTSLGHAWDQRCKVPKYVETNAAYDRLAQRLKLDLRVEHDQMLKCFGRLGRDELSRRNKLSPAENERLARSQDMHEILALLVKGLAQLRAPARTAPSLRTTDRDAVPHGTTT